MKVFIGIDVGASHISAGVFDEGRAMRHVHRLPLKSPLLPEELVLGIKTAVFFCLKAEGLSPADIAKIGIALPGTVDTRLGVLLQACNLSITDFPLTSSLCEVFEAPVFLENDANCAALAEYHLGSAQKAKSLVLLTIGTGIGGSLILDGRLIHGCHFGAGEIGHMVIERNGRPCSCGREGCFETYASAAALVRMTKEAMENSPESLMWKLTNGRLDKADGTTAFAARREKDAAATEVVRSYASYLACGIGNLINILEPDTICLGGGVSREGDDLLIPVIESLCSFMWVKNSVPFYTRLVCAAFGNDAAMIGATLLG